MGAERFSIAKCMFPVLVAAGLVLASYPALSQGYTGDGWVRTNSIAIVNGVGGASTDQYDPYVQAYEGQNSTTTYAQADYSQEFHAVAPVTHGQLSWGFNLVGSLGFFSNPQNPGYHSEANGEFEDGPPDFNVSGGSNYEVGTNPTFETFLQAKIYNYGHASAELTVAVQPLP